MLCRLLGVALFLMFRLDLDANVHQYLVLALVRPRGRRPLATVTIEVVMLAEIFDRYLKYKQGREESCDVMTDPEIMTNLWGRVLLLFISSCPCPLTDTGSAGIGENCGIQVFKNLKKTISLCPLFPFV